MTDQFRTKYLAEIKENASARRRYLETIEFLEGQLAAAKSGHEGQKRNTIAFLKERDAAIEGLRKVRSYNVDIAAGRINYRPHDHIQVIDEALKAAGYDTCLVSSKDP